MMLDLTPLFINEGMRLPFEDTLDLSDVDFFGTRPLREPVRVSALFENRAGVVTMNGNAYLRFEAPCDRCTAHTVKELTAPLRHLLMTGAEGEETEEMVLVPGMRLDTDELLRCDVLLALPVKHLCGDDCKGLCPNCGKNLNEGGCCCKNPVDPRLEGLLQLLD